MRRILFGFFLLSVLGMLGQVQPLFPWVPLDHNKTGPRGQLSLSDIVIKYHDINSVSLAVSNTGQIGNVVITGGEGGFWPRGSPNNYVFGTGLWIGGIADIDGDEIADTLFLQAYDPLSSGTEFQEGRYGQSPSDPLASVFKSTDPGDLENWPPEFSDPGGDPIVLSDQDLVTIYQSVDGEPLFATPNPPIEIRQRSLAFTTGLTDQVIYFVFDIENISHEVAGMDSFTLEDAWIGYDSDMDLGDEFSDDRTSFIDWLTTPGEDSIPVMTAFAWDEDFNEMNFVGDPGFVGIAYIQSPGNFSDGIDNDRDGMIDESPFNGIDDDGDGIIDDQPDEVDQMGLVNYTFHNNPSVPGPRGDPQSDSEGYRIMSCVPPEECVETTVASDVRFMMTSGPFSMEPGQVHRIVVAFVFANAIGDPDSLEVYGDPPRPDPNDPVLAEFMQVIHTARHLYPFVGIEDDSRAGDSPLPRSFSLSQNYPNPFNPTTMIPFDIPDKNDGKQLVTLTIYDLRGRHVKTLVSEELAPGNHQIVWNGRNEQGQQVSSGIYLYTLKSGDERYTRRMVVFK
jgi:hypothetical protein